MSKTNVMQYAKITWEPSSFSAQLSFLSCGATSTISTEWIRRQPITTIVTTSANCFSWTVKPSFWLFMVSSAIVPISASNTPNGASGCSTSQPLPCLHISWQQATCSTTSLHTSVPTTWTAYRRWQGTSSVLRASSSSCASSLCLSSSRTRWSWNKSRN